MTQRGHEFTTRRSTKEKRSHPEVSGLAEQARNFGKQGIRIIIDINPDTLPMSARRAVGRSSLANAGKEVRGGAPAASDGAVHRPVVSPGVRRFSGKE